MPPGVAKPQKTAVQNTIPTPPPLAQRWIKLLLGFGVSVAIGLSPYLGRVGIPIFDSLLKLIPASIQDTALPLSSALMGIIAVFVQWYGTSRDGWVQRRLERLFAGSLVFSLMLWVVLFVVYVKAVVRVPILGSTDYQSFVVGFDYPHKEPCFTPKISLSRAQCISDKLTLNTDRITSYWGDDNVNNGEIALLSAHFAFSASFGFLVGCVVIRGEQSKIKKKGAKK